MNKVLLLALGIGLVACAPAQTRQPLSTDALFAPVGEEAAAICAGQPRITENAVLVWNNGPQEIPQGAPYLLSCPDFAIKNDGSTLLVQGRTLQEALTHFDPGAYFLSYYADLFLRFPEDGLVSADALDSVPEVLMDNVRRVRVTASQAGKDEMTLIRSAHVTPVRYNPAQPLKLMLRGDGPTPWPEVTVEASKGLIIAPIFR
ncbi:hypothetical protein [Deinococcus arenicola]|uniref:Uncharacterized protein n=1 Tax=Deinococcus arenicola TaxID=2994950 RepID=A0ABU4DTP2_9DEIO|nr:hypothetical protein [Deinococcus sp. ZS9-10]MDV6375049.1 hypothetical protein [Deinococcus sp. ZS9-10]